ncbi:Vms1/Ankzf1 family peptidyl-tRNA hydrolase [Actinotalea sp. C106]|uniref:baeRF2 domain-containing protein n=1 Tax=Actinotalea sp. C106 TaxID=2908644 RepID=UPI00202784CA|nr:Vms1/Ankzf1 family peptidyl-tRNA hydrolase [Actinotalea sp. C106]
MKLDSLKPLLDHDGPLTTVSLDVTRADEAGDRDVKNRWQGLRRTLEQHGAPEATLAVVAEAVLRPTHVPGRHGRFVVAAGEEILFDRILADAPSRDEAFHDGVPALMPAAQAADEAVRYLLVEVDRQGADLSWSGTDSHRPDEQLEHVEGDHDVLHKVRAGGWSHRRMQSRVEDSWERNAEAVATELDRAVVEHRPELVLITGDVRAVALIRDAVGRPTAEIMTEVPGGSRADGVKEDAFAENLHRVVEAYRARRREGVADRLREGLGRGAGAVTSLGDVLDVLRRGQVAELVIVEDAAGTPAQVGESELWVGPGPLEIAARRSELDALGVSEQDARQMRADVAILRAALAQDAGVTFALEGSIDVVDGLAALLRWSDAATPHETAPSYTEDSHRQGHH